MVKPSRLAIYDRVEIRDGVPVLGSFGAKVAEVVDRLENENFAEIRLEPADLVAAIAFDALEPDGPSLVQARPRRPKLLAALSQSGVPSLYTQSSQSARLALAAGLLQIHDFWDASHEAAQQADDLGERSVSAYWHGIAHRREPDPGNASYWFRRVGPHPLFPVLAEQARPLLEPSQAARLLPGDRWDPFAFLTFANPRQADASTISLARALQRLEMRLLLEASIPS
jgi:hypothetical protein